MPMLATKDSSGDSIEEEAMTDFKSAELPPLYVDIQEEIEMNMEDANNKFAQLKKLQAQSLKVSFNINEKDEAKLQNDAFDKTR
jgi:hypothetical protein